MKKIVCSVLVVMALAWAGSASSALLPPVIVGGTEWLQPLDFTSYSWNTLNTVCSETTGACTGSLGGNDLTGWTWASVSDMNALLNYYIGTAALGLGPSQVTSAADWVTEMLADGFLRTETSAPPFASNWISGRLRTSSTSSSSYIGRMGNLTIPPFGTLTIADTDQTIGKSFSTNFAGAWLHRGDLTTIAVPITDTLTLVGLGLCGLGFIRRTHALYA